MIRRGGEQKMAEEVKLSPGWLLRDVRRAAERLEPSQHKDGVSARGERTAHSTEQTDKADHEGHVGNDYRDVVSS
jgi:hypothetical protein